MVISPSNLTERLRELADRVIGPVDRAFGRPWMGRHPAASTRTVVVGANAATPFPAGVVARDVYLDALLTGGHALDSIYAAARHEGAPSPTRVNITRLVDALETIGLGPVLETNAVPIATGRLAGLAKVDPAWRARSAQFLAELISTIRPTLVIVHGAEAAKLAGVQLGQSLTSPKAPSFRAPFVQRLHGGGVLATIPSMSPPAANLWMPRRPSWPDEIAAALRIQVDAPGPADPFERFVAAQRPVYAAVIDELRRGLKTSHWMWFVFPQIGGLGHSEMARRHAISSLDEARAYLAHPVLGARLLECARLVIAVRHRTAVEIFGSIDAMKLRSCMTLFRRAAPNEGVFQDVLDRYFGGVPDPATEERLR